MKMILINYLLAKLFDRDTQYTFIAPVHIFNTDKCNLVIGIWHYCELMRDKGRDEQVR